MPSTPTLVLIGPAAAGKTTLGEQAARLLGVPFVDLDEIGERYYAEVGWSLLRLGECSRQVGRVAAERLWEPARAHAVARAVAEHPGAVLALGAGHTSYTDSRCLARVSVALADAPGVALILPSADREASLAELRRRALSSKGTSWISNGHDFLAEWLDDPGMHSLATEVVYTEGRSLGAVAAQLAAVVGSTR